MTKAIEELDPVVVSDGSDFPSEFLTRIAEANLSAKDVGEILAEFRSVITPGDVLQEAYAIQVVDEHDQEGMDRARSLRLRLRNERTRLESLRKEKKEPLLRRIQVLDGSVKIVRDWFSDAEAHLRRQEETGERIRAARREKVVVERSEALRPYVENVTPFLAGLVDLEQSEFDALLASQKEAHELRQKARAEEAANAERLARENAELRARQAEADAEVRKAEEALQAMQRREEERRRAEEAERRSLARERARELAAPDREKLMAFADKMESLEVPQIDDTTVHNEVQRRIRELAEWTRAQAAMLRAKEDTDGCPF